MSNLMELCDIAWELYDKWSNLADTKEQSKSKNKDLDRRVTGAWDALKAHMKECPHCHNPENDV